MIKKWLDAGDFTHVKNGDKVWFNKKAITQLFVTIRFAIVKGRYSGGFVLDRPAREDSDNRSFHYSWFIPWSVQQIKDTITGE